MNVFKQKVVSLTEDEVNAIERVVCILDKLEDELEGEYDYDYLREDLLEIRYKKYVIGDESQD